MDGFDQSRSHFLRKIGLTLGVGTFLPSSYKIAFGIQEKRDEFPLTAEQSTFMKHYEQWIDEFIPVIRRQKEDPEDYENNKKIVVLSEKAKSLQKELTGYMQDENFARHYMIVTERMTFEI
jgi:hypothetical protein